MRDCCVAMGQKENARGSQVLVDFSFYQQAVLVFSSCFRRKNALTGTRAGETDATRYVGNVAFLAGSLPARRPV